MNSIILQGALEIIIAISGLVFVYLILDCYVMPSAIDIDKLKLNSSTQKVFDNSCKKIIEVYGGTEQGVCADMLELLLTDGKLSDGFKDYVKSKGKVRFSELGVCMIGYYEKEKGLVTETHEVGGEHTDTDTDVWGTDNTGATDDWGSDSTSSTDDWGMDNTGVTDGWSTDSTDSMSSTDGWGSDDTDGWSTDSTDSMSNTDGWSTDSTGGIDDWGSDSASGIGEDFL